MQFRKESRTYITFSRERGENDLGEISSKFFRSFDPWSMLFSLSIKSRNLLIVLTEMLKSAIRFQCVST